MERNGNERFDLVIRRINELSAIYRNAASESGVSANEFWVWHTLMGERRELTQRDICSICGLPKQTVNSIVRNMVRRKQATLEARPLDRNRKRIRLTDAGHAFGQELLANTLEAERRAFCGLSEQAQEGALLFLEEYLPRLDLAVSGEGAE